MKDNYIGIDKQVIFIKREACNKKQSIILPDKWTQTNFCGTNYV